MVNMDLYVQYIYIYRNLFRSRSPSMTINVPGVQADVVEAPEVQGIPGDSYRSIVVRCG